LKQKFRKIALLFVLAATPFGLGADRNERIRTLSGNFICVCGCHQLLNACNHFNCPSSGPMFTELGMRVDQGMTDEQIVAHFVEKYGTTVLAAPPASGFNLAAWIMPFAALLIGSLAAIYFLRQFRSRWAGTAEASPELAKYQSKVEEELKKFTPED
jgi:cytochrome c-type biogenesis protein CcmH/NrfF